MIYHKLESLPSAYRHVYLSPHLDDAALSCGAAIGRWREAGEGVLVVTICTAAPPPAGSFSDLATSFHAAWGLSPAEVVAARLREDAVAMEALGVDALWVGELDAIYRHPVAYGTRETLFGRPAEDDTLLPALRRLVADLRLKLPGASFYAPLGVGYHVDHQLTCRAALELAGAPLALYEDFPYVARAGTLEARLAELPAPLTPRVVAPDAAPARKLAAIGAYTSQIAELAANQLGRSVADGEAMAVMASGVEAYGRLAGGERVWVRSA